MFQRAVLICFTFYAQKVAESRLTIEELFSNTIAWEKIIIPCFLLFHICFKTFLQPIQ